MLPDTGAQKKTKQWLNLTLINFFFKFYDLGSMFEQQIVFVFFTLNVLEVVAQSKSVHSPEKQEHVHCLLRSKF